MNPHVNLSHASAGSAVSTSLDELGNQAALAMHLATLYSLQSPDPGLVRMLFAGSAPAPPAAAQSRAPSSDAAMLSIPCTQPAEPGNAPSLAVRAADGSPWRGEFGTAPLELGSEFARLLLRSTAQPSLVLGSADPAGPDALATHTAAAYTASGSLQSSALDGNHRGINGSSCYNNTAAAATTAEWTPRRSTLYSPISPPPTTSQSMVQPTLASEMPSAWTLSELEQWAAPRTPTAARSTRSIATAIHGTPTALPISVSGSAYGLGFTDPAKGSQTDSFIDRLLACTPLSDPGSHSGVALPLSQMNMRQLGVPLSPVGNLAAPAFAVNSISPPSTPHRPNTTRKLPLTPRKKRNSGSTTAPALSSGSTSTSTSGVHSATVGTPSPTKQHRTRPRNAATPVARPRNAFIIFRSQRYHTLPDSLTFNERSRQIALEWHSMPYSEKLVYQQQAEYEKASHQEAHPEYHFRKRTSIERRCNCRVIAREAVRMVGMGLQPPTRQCKKCTEDQQRESADASEPISSGDLPETHVHIDDILNMPLDSWLFPDLGL